MNSAWLFFLAIAIIKETLSDEITKCCGVTEVLIKDDNSYKCSEDLTQRHQVLTKNTNFLKNSVSDKCFDVFNNNFVNYNVNSNDVVPYTGRFYPKCCPLDSVYNSKLHSCIKNVTSDLNFINESFVKIGLPNCRVVVDFDVKTKDYQFEYTRKSVQDLNSFCFDKNENNLFVLRECHGFESCRNVKCIKKCCPDGQSFINGSKCFDTFEHGLNLTEFDKNVENPEDKYAIIHNRTCRKIYKMALSSDLFLHKDGSFTEWSNHKLQTTDATNMESYCIEHALKEDLAGYFIFHCFPDKQEFSKYESRIWPLALSCTFLILTVFVYVVIKEYKKMFGKILMDYCLASFLLFGLLLWNEMVDRPAVLECQIKSYGLIFLAISQFTWANVLSFEIWCTFGTTKFYSGSKQVEMQIKKFVMYSLYGWGVPLILTLTVFLFYNWKVLPEAIQPYLANRKCFIESDPGNYAKLLFFSLPLSIIQMVNMAFFVKTVIYCMKIKNEINKINDVKSYSNRKYQHDKDRLFLIIKLSIIMGISYIFEVVTGFVNMSELGDVPKYTEIVLDVYNALQGVFIFIIFICKRKIILACLQKLKISATNSTNSTAFPSTRTQSSLTLNGVVLNNFGSKDKISNKK